MSDRAQSRLAAFTLFARLLAVGVVAAWLMLAGLMLAGAAVAQQGGAAQQGTATAEPSGSEAVTRADVDRLVKVLRDDAARERLIQELSANGTAPSGTKAAEPDRPVTRFLVTLGETVTDIGTGLSDLGTFFSDVPLLLRWFEVRFGTPERRAELFWNMVRVLAILGAGFAVQIGAGYALAGWRRRLAAREIQGRSRRIGLAVTHSAIALLPLAAFWIAALATLAFVRPEKPVTLFTVAVINAHVLSGVLVLVPAMVLAPTAPSLRLLRLDDAMAGRLYSVTRAVISVAAYGSFGALALATYMPSWVYLLVIKFVGILVAVLLAVLVLRAHEAASMGVARESPLDRILRLRLADVWHLGALGFLAIAVVVWLARGGDGILFLARALTLTGLALGVATAVLAGFRWGVARLLSILERYAARDFSFAARLQVYVGGMSWIAMAAVTGVTLVAVAEAWAIPLLDWLEQAGGRRLLASLLSVAVIIAVGVAIWEALNLMAERLIRVEEKGAGGIRRQARLRTLLPFIRRASLALLVLFLGLIGLSELGINIGPLLAGAGVVGIAVGFGAQQIVKDIFGGISVLVEDSIVVGDIVEVAGKGGVVEWMSMRALRLRDFEGTVHTVPFGDITTVSNRSRNFAFAVLRIGVAYDSNIPEVQDAIRATCARLREMPDFSAMVLDDVEMHGIENFGDSAVVLLARIKVAPAKQWAVSRQFHVLLKEEFDRRGIEIPFPQRTITVRDERSADALAIERRADEPPASLAARRPTPARA